MGSSCTSLLTLALVVALRMAVTAVHRAEPFPFLPHQGCCEHSTDAGCTDRPDSGSFPKVELFNWEN